MDGHILRKEGKHYKHQDISFWAEEGTVMIEDHRNGDFNVVTCRDFALRAKALNEEARKCHYQVDRDNINDWVIKMHTVWKEAKSQGDPTDIEVMKAKYRERRKAVMVTGLW